MNTTFSRVGICIVATIGLLVLVLGAAAGHALPKGYKEDYNGCADIEDQKERKDCCRSVWSDCVAQCKKLNDADAAIRCNSDCMWSTLSCEDGEHLNAMVTWTGFVGAVADAKADAVRDGKVPLGGLSIAPSRSSVTFDVMVSGDGSDRAPESTTLLARCQCPDELVRRGLECRAMVGAHAAECMLCRPDTDDLMCIPCPTCVSTLEPVGACSDDTDQGRAPANEPIARPAPAPAAAARWSVVPRATFAVQSP